MCWILVNLPDSEMPSTKRVGNPIKRVLSRTRFDALLCLQSPHPKDIIPRRGPITGAKVVNYFELRKRRAIFLRFLLGELPPSTKPVAGYLAGKSASTKPVAVTLEILADRKQRLLLARKCALCRDDYSVIIRQSHDEVTMKSR